MKTLNSCRQAFNIGMAAAVLAACGGNQSAAPQLPAMSVQIGSASGAHSAYRVSPDGIVYTPADVKIANYKYKLDLNNDETTDFIISEFNTSHYGCSHRDHSGHLESISQSPNGVERFEAHVARLASGSPIGPGQSFATGTWRLEAADVIWIWYGGRCTELRHKSGHWPPKASGYLGLAFLISGKTHYGWAAITVSSPVPGWLAATLTGYAYQTIAGKSINAGQK